MREGADLAFLSYLTLPVYLPILRTVPSAYHPLTPSPGRTNKPGRAIYCIYQLSTYQPYLRYLGKVR